MVGKIHELRGQLYFTTPRTIFLEAYHKYMASRDGCGFQEDSSYSEAAVQKQLQETVHALDFLLLNFRRTFRTPSAACLA